MLMPTKNESDKPTPLMILRSKEIREAHEQAKEKSRKHYAKYGIDVD